MEVDEITHYKYWINAFEWQVDLSLEGEEPIAPMLQPVRRISFTMG